MTKNITVIDENGNILERTYPKRANGLVKKGRAQWIGDSSIRLCPSLCKEENEMANNIYEVLDNQISKMQDQLQDVCEESSTPVRLQILKTFEMFRLQEQNARVANLIEKQLDILQESMKEDEALPEHSLARETTRQKILELMEKLIPLSQEKQNDISES